MEKLTLAMSLLLLASGCVHSTIVPFHSSSKNQPAKFYPATNPKSVGIFRSTNPYSSYDEIGLITFRTQYLDLPKVYNQLRTDASRQGANAVVDVKIHGETHTEMRNETVCMPRTVCSSDGSCTTENECYPETEPETVSTFVIDGSMVRRTQ